MTGVTPRAALPALLAGAALALTACSGGSSSSEPGARGPGSSASPTSSTSTSSTPSTSSTSSSSSATAPGSPEVVEGVSLTSPGSRLKVGDTARVSWKPDQTTTAVIAVTVTRLLKVPISTFDDWRLDPATRRSTPYFVHATVRNLGRSDLSHVPVPLYLLDGRETLLQARRLLARFTPCPSRPLPARFEGGDKASVCLVYFAPRHGKLVAVSFRPTEDFDPITWRGRLAGGSEPQRHATTH
jgi:hypothetical protein